MFIIYGYQVVHIWKQASYLDNKDTHRDTGHSSYTITFTHHYYWKVIWYKTTVCKWGVSCVVFCMPTSPYKRAMITLKTNPLVSHRHNKIYCPLCVNWTTADTPWWMGQRHQEVCVLTPGPPWLCEVWAWPHEPLSGRPCGVYVGAHSP